MSRPITWKGVQAESQRDALLGQAQALQNIQQGIGGLRGLFEEQQNRLATERLNEEQAALDSVLNRISGINTVEGLDAARENQLIADSGLTDKQQLAARNALNSQTASLMNRINTRNQYDATQLANKERPVINDINKLAAQGNYGEALELAGGLSNSGELIKRLTTEQRAYDKRTSLEDAEQNLNFNLQDIIRSRKANNQVSQRVLEDAPWLKNGLSVAKDGTLQLKSGLTTEQKERYAPELAKAQQMYSSASNPADLSLQLFKRAFGDENINVNDIGGLLNSISAFQAVDPVYQQQQKDNALRQELTNLGEQAALSNIDRQLKEVGSSFPKNPVYEAALDNTISVNDTLDKFSKFTESNNQFFALGGGNEAAFRKNTLQGVRKFEKFIQDESKKYPEGSKSRQFLQNFTVSGNLLNTALSNIDEIIEAKKEGNLGDSYVVSSMPEPVKELFRKVGLTDEVVPEDVFESLKTLLPSMVSATQAMEGKQKAVQDLEARKLNTQLEALRKRAGI